MIANSRPQSRRSTTLGLSDSTWVVVMTGLAVFVVMLMRPALSVRGPSPQAECRLNLKQIAIGLLNYEADWGVLPPAMTTDLAGNPLHSWRTLILPYMNQSALYRSIDLSKPWDDPANEDARSSVLSVYRCPNATDSVLTKTTYLAVVTKESCIGRTEGRQLPLVANDQRRSIMVVEVSPAQAVEWMSPADADETALVGLPSENAISHAGVFHAAFADGGVDTLPGDLGHDEWLDLISTVKSEH